MVCLPLRHLVIRLPPTALPASALREVTGRPLSFYVHVPFCRVRCGYCDFNTYTADQLGPGGGPDAWLAAVHSEIDLAARVLGEQAPEVSTVFFGGGTLTLLRPSQLTEVLAHIAGRFGLRPGAEATTEANPETIGPAELDALLVGGINRLESRYAVRCPACAGHPRPGTPRPRARGLVGLARQAGFGRSAWI